MREGDVIDQRYRVEKKLGQGGMGEVFRGTDAKMKKTVAIKVLFPNTPDLIIKRFHTEARALAALNHPNVMKVLDFGQALDGQLYLIMDYVKGDSLASLIERRGVQTFFDMLPYFERICRGLRFAHKNGVLHRDIKPSNVMLEDDRSREDSVKLVDFGLAKMVKQDHELTTTGSAMGSPPYMSPEAIHGKESDERSDIYSLGCTFFEMMVAQPPFVGDTQFHTMMAHLNRLAPTLSEVSDKEYEEEVEEFIKKCIKKNPDDRFQNMDELIAALERVKKTLIEKRTASMGILASGIYSSGAFIRGQARKLEWLKKFSVASVAGWGVLVTVILVAVIVPFSQKEQKQDIQSGALSEMAQEVEKLDSEQITDMVEHRTKHRRGVTVCKDPGSPFQICLLSGELPDEEARKQIIAHSAFVVFQLDDLKISDESMDFLLHIPMQKLIVQKLKLTETLLNEIGGMPKLIHLIIRDCDDLPENTLSHFQKLQLQTIDVETGKKYKNAGTHLSKIKSLNAIMIEKGILTRTDISDIATLPNLGMLNLQKCDLADDAFVDLKNAKKLMVVEKIDGTLTEQQVEQIAAVPNLVSVNFHRTNMNNEWLKKFYNCKHLRQVAFTYTTVTSEGAAALKAKVPTLTEVIIGSGAPEEQLLNDYSKY